MKIRTAVLVLAVAAVVACTSCDVVTYEGPDTGPKVAETGDSITAMSQRYLALALYDHPHYIKGIVGIDLHDALDQIVRPAVQSKPDILVLELGANSATVQWDASDVVDVSNMYEAVKGVPCVLWVTVTATPDSKLNASGKGLFRDRITQMRKAVQAKLPQYPNVRLHDFGPIEDAHPEWYVGDGIHLNDEGMKAFSMFVRNAVKTGCPS